MITISVCMIVKNEEKNLGECLDCLIGIADEIVIVDTGSTDRTKQIASEYTDKVYDFEWSNDFSAARNFSFSKATMDYIYVADADELIDNVNQERFIVLKNIMLPEIEIVQMKYTNQLAYGTTYNFDTEYRGKMYKRIRNFTWIDQIHETVRLTPVVYDSEIEIIHNPHESHASRDFKTFTKITKDGGILSSKLINMYTKELFIAGEDENFIDAWDYFFELYNSDTTSHENFKYAACVLLRTSRIKKDYKIFFEIALKLASDNPFSEVCCELGEYYFEQTNYKEAILWLYNAAYECKPLLNIHKGGDYPLKMIAKCYKELGDNDSYEIYKKKSMEWSEGL